MAKRCWLEMQSLRLLLQTLERSFRFSRVAASHENVWFRNHHSRLRPLLHQTLQRWFMRFLCNKSYTYFCGLQTMKPEACKLWPFKVIAEPKYGAPNQAVFDYMGNKIYVYVDTMCSGLRYGEPPWDFRYKTVKEFTELALGVRQVQYKSTRAVSNWPNKWGRQLFP